MYLPYIKCSFSIKKWAYSQKSAFIAEATEIIGVVRIGVSLVEYIYKGTDEVGKKLSQRLYFLQLTRYTIFLIRVKLEDPNLIYLKK